MNTRTPLLTLFALLVGTFAFTPGAALADRDGGRDRERQQQSRSAILGT